MVQFDSPDKEGLNLREDASRLSVILRMFDESTCSKMSTGTNEEIEINDWSNRMNNKPVFLGSVALDPGSCRSLTDHDELIVLSEWRANVPARSAKRREIVPLS